MTTSLRLLSAATLAAVAIGPATAAQAATRPPIKDCGDVSTLDQGGFFLGAVTAHGGACTNARAVASRVARTTSCKTKGTCHVRTYACLLAKAGKELTLVHCENARQTAFVRFEFGS
jgi:hypothetical protein